MKIEDFVRESNRIEGILRDPLPIEVFATQGFLEHKSLHVGHLTGLVSSLQPDAKLRDRYGLDVRVGNHFPPKGSPEIGKNLQTLLDEINAGRLNPYSAHVRYETLHPFTDGNGRSGRAIWLWQMKSAPLGFLHHFYYQSLQNARP